jgi:hypothetical protein
MLVLRIAIRTIALDHNLAYGLDLKFDLVILSFIKKSGLADLVIWSDFYQ